MLLTRRQRMKVHVKSCTYSTRSEHDTRETGTSDETKYHSVTVPSESLIAGEDDSTSETVPFQRTIFHRRHLYHRNSLPPFNWKLLFLSPPSEVTTQNKVSPKAHFSATPVPSFSDKGNDRKVKEKKVKGRRFMSGAHNRKVNVKVTCLHCNEIISQKNLKRHVRRYHGRANTNKLRAVGVDC